MPSVIRDTSSFLSVRMLSVFAIGYEEAFADRGYRSQEAEKSTTEIPLVSHPFVLNLLHHNPPQIISKPPLDTSQKEGQSPRIAWRGRQTGALALSVSSPLIAATCSTHSIPSHSTIEEIALQDPDALDGGAPDGG